MIIHYFEQDIIKYLLSYLHTYSGAEFETMLLNSSNISELENSQENYLLFSSTSVGDLPLLLELLMYLRNTYDHLHINIVLGGAMHYMLDNHDLLKFFPEVTHVCIGKGEEFLKDLIEKSLPKGMYFAEDFEKIRPYVVSGKYTLHNSVLVTFNDNRCSWRKCLFCHHQAKYMRPVQPPQSVANDVAYYVEECGYRNFFFYDNQMDPHLLQEFLEILYAKGYQQKGVTFYLFGLRVDMDREALRPILEKWKPSPITGGAWGVEFYDQEILDLYQKNIRLCDVDRSLLFFSTYGISNEVYLLLGLPLVRKNHIENLQQFVDTVHSKVSEFRTSFFLLNKSLRVFSQQDRFKIRVKDHYTLQDLFFDREKIPPVKTVFLDFDSWDEDARQYVNRDYTLKKYSGLFLNKKMRMLYNLCFVEKTTCQFLETLRKLGSFH